MDVRVSHGRVLYDKLFNYYIIKTDDPLSNLKKLMLLNLSWKQLCPELYSRAVWFKFTEVSEELAAFIITHYPDDGGIKYLPKAGNVRQTTQCRVPLQKLEVARLASQNFAAFYMQLK